jgi:hypothetical protein
MFRLCNRKRPFLDGERHQRQHRRTGNSMKDIAGERMGNQYTLIGYNMRVLSSPFGDNAVAGHPSIIRTLRDGFVLHQRRVKQLGRLDIRPAPTQVGQGDDLDPRFRRRRIDQRAALGEGQNRWRGICWRKDKVSVSGRPSRNLPIDHAFDDRIAADQFSADCQPRIGVRCRLYAELAERARHPAHMTGEINQPAVQH